MSRTETCFNCEGSGTVELLTGEAPCSECSGNGYIDTVDANAEVAPLVEPGDQIEIDLTNDKPTPGRMANQTWRILEEQRQAAEETIRECDAEIERWSTKLQDAVKAKRMAEAGQAVLDGEA